MRAAAGGHVEAVTKLAELGADLAAADKVRTVFSVSRGVGYLLLLLACNGMLCMSMCMSTHQEGVTALMLAATEGHLKVVVKLAELGADTSAADNVSNPFFICRVKL